MMERIWELKEVCVNRSCLLNFENFAGFSALFSTRLKSEEVEKKKKHALVQLLTNHGVILRPSLNLKGSRKSSLVPDDNLKQP